MRYLLNLSLSSYGFFFQVSRITQGTNNIIDEDPTSSVSFDHIDIPGDEIENLIDNFEQRSQEAESQYLCSIANDGDNNDG
jgi:hypothetical protein